MGALRNLPGYSPGEIALRAVEAGCQRNATLTRPLAAVPLDERYFEDYVPGSVVDCGTIAVDHDEVLAFGRRFDPQPFHADPEKAARGPFGGVIASGWHTGALMMRLFVERYISSVASLGSPGAESLSPSPS